LTHSEARDIIKNSSGKAFDPIIVNAFVESEDEFIRIAFEHKNALGAG